MYIPARTQINNKGALKLAIRASLHAFLAALPLVVAIVVVDSFC